MPPESVINRLPGIPEGVGSRCVWSSCARHCLLGQSGRSPSLRRTCPGWLVLSPERGFKSIIDLIVRFRCRYSLGRIRRPWPRVELVRRNRTGRGFLIVPRNTRSRNWSGKGAAIISLIRTHPHRVQRKDSSFNSKTMSPALPLRFWLCERGWKRGKRHACRVRGSIAPVKFGRDLRRSEPNPVLYCSGQIKGWCSGHRHRRLLWPGAAKYRMMIVPPGCCDDCQRSNSNCPTVRCFGDQFSWR